MFTTLQGAWGRFAALGLALVAGIATLLGAPEPAVAAMSPGHAQVLNVAHRGASGEFPENTLPAVRAATERGADMVEIDVQLTTDNRLVVIHDTTLSRTTNVEKVFPDRAPWDVGDFSYAEIRRLDAGSWFAPEFDDVRVPTLSQVLRTLNDTGSGLLLEVKSPSLYPGIGKRIVEVLRAHPRWLGPAEQSHRLVVQSFDWTFMRDFHDLLPRTPVGLLGYAEPEQLAGLATFADQINPNYEDVSAGYIDRVHDLGMDVLVWTLHNQPDVARRMVELGVDGIITNYPGVLDDVLRDGRAGSFAETVRMTPRTPASVAA